MNGIAVKPSASSGWLRTIEKSMVALASTVIPSFDKTYVRGAFIGQRQPWPLQHLKKRGISMYKRVEVPMQSVEDVISWHRHQIQLAEARKAGRMSHPQATSLPRFTALKLKEDQKKIDFHQSIVTILEVAQSRMVVLDGLKHPFPSSTIHETSSGA